MFKSLFGQMDRYILRKFFSTYLVVLGCFVLISVVFDITEKLDDFLSGEATMWQIVYQYYFNFVPYYAILLTPLLLFLSVVFFTSRMTNQNEVIAILNTGNYYGRLFFPYMVGAAIVCGLNIYANHYLLPGANARRVAFEDQYIRNQRIHSEDNIYMQVAKNTYMHLQNFNGADTSGFKFSINKFNNGKLEYKLRADRIVWQPEIKSWKLLNYQVRRNYDIIESFHQGRDTMVQYNFKPEDFDKDVEDIKTLNTPDLNEMLESEREKGSDALVFFYIEKYSRTSFPFAIFILTVIGVSVSTRKVRGGTGIHLVFGIALSFSYIMFQQFASVFATNSSLSPLLGVWIPNILYLMIAILLFRLAPK